MSIIAALQWRGLPLPQHTGHGGAGIGAAWYRDGGSVQTRRGCDLTPARKAALQWFHDRGEVSWFAYAEIPPSDTMRRRMIADGQLQWILERWPGPIVYSLTDKGRRMLHGGDK